LQVVESGASSLSDQIVKDYKKGSLVIICDCCTHEDLRNIKKAIVSLNLKTLPVGSAGLFKEIFEEAKPLSPPFLVVCGSLNQVTRKQITNLIRKKGANYLELNLSLILSGKGQDELKRLIAKGRTILKKKKDLIIATPENYWKVKKGENVNIVKKQINQFLAHVVKHFIQTHLLAGVIATGGDTATELLNSLQTQTMEIIGELEPLVPIGIIRGGKREGLPIITKTGGFGTDEVFLKAVNYLVKRSIKIEE